MAKAKKAAGIKSLDPVQRQCLAGMKVSPAERNMIPVGVHKIDFTVRVFGTLSVGEDDEVFPTVKLLSVPVIALALQRMGIQRERFIDTITTIANEAGDRGMSVTDCVKEDIENIEEYMAKLQEQLAAKLDKVPRKGKCIKALVHNVTESNMRVKLLRNKSTVTEAADAVETSTVSV